MINKIKQFFKDKKGFTLVELMVVVAILGVLTMVAIPVFNNSTKKAETTTCQANQRTIESAISMYQADKGAGKLPADVAELVTDGYLKEAPKCPSYKEDTDAAYNIDKQGNVTCLKETSHNKTTTETGGGTK